MSTTRNARTGLALLGLLSLGDVAAPLLTDGEHPPMTIALVACALGLASLALVVAGWRGSTRAVLPLVGLRALSALSAVPAFFVPDVPSAARAVAAVVVALTTVGTVLVVGGVRAPVLAGSAR